MIKILNMLVPVAEMVFRGPAAKAKAGAATTALATAFQNGLIAGSASSVEELGFQIGQVVIAGFAGWVITWLPANKAKQ